MGIRVDSSRYIGELLSAKKRFLVLIPAYNEQSNISFTVRDVRTVLKGADVLVIDDGSSDRTAEEARKAGAAVVSLPVNLGVGGAVQTGFLYALRNGYRSVVRLDADGQHRAKDIGAVLQQLDEGVDLVVGSRFIRKDGFQGMKLRRFGIRLIAALCHVLNGGLHINDPTSGFRGYSRKALLLFQKRYPTDYPEPEELIMAVNARCSIREVAVIMKPRRSGRSSIGGWVSLYYFLKVILATFIEKSRGKHVSG